jgi:hypothetical protein
MPYDNQAEIRCQALRLRPAESESLLEDALATQCSSKSSRRKLVSSSNVESRTFVVIFHFDSGIDRRLQLD